MKIKIYQNIVAKAKDRGISINSLEQKAEVSKGSLSKWDTVSPSVDTLKRVANVLECTVEELLEE